MHCCGGWRELELPHPTRPASPRGRDLGEIVVVTSMPGKSPSVEETRKTYPFAKMLVFKDSDVIIFRYRHHIITQPLPLDPPSSTSRHWTQP
jgi:hypothetical protein